MAIWKKPFRLVELSTRVCVELHWLRILILNFGICQQQRSRSVFLVYKTMSCYVNKSLNRINRQVCKVEEVVNRSFLSSNNLHTTIFEEFGYLGNFVQCVHQSLLNLSISRISKGNWWFNSLRGLGHGFEPLIALPKDPKRRGEGDCMILNEIPAGLIVKQYWEWDICQNLIKARTQSSIRTSASYQRSHCINQFHK